MHLTAEVLHGRIIILPHVRRCAQRTVVYHLGRCEENTTGALERDRYIYMSSEAIS
jgi:hypothetical protein